MKHSVLVCGYSPGISLSVACRLGKAGHPAVPGSIGTLRWNTFPDLEGDRLIVPEVVRHD